MPGSVFAAIHIVQNPTSNLLQSPNKLWRALHIPQWPQAGLIPRSSERGQRFEHVAYFGNECNLAKELRTKTWKENLKELGLSWRVVSREQWHDYSDVDVVIAVRGFGNDGYSHKPPSKLLNCWLSGVPSILGFESAYRSIRQSEFDYIEVRSLSETLEALKRLRDDFHLRASMTQACAFRAKEIQPSQMVERWSALVSEQIIPAYNEWASSSAFRQTINLCRRKASAFEQRAYNRLSEGQLSRLRSRVGLRSRIKRFRVTSLNEK
jgi:hypothetical protein